MFTKVDENELLSIDELCERLFISNTTAISYLNPVRLRALKSEHGKFLLRVLMNISARNVDKNAELNKNKCIL
ncbi:MAG: hypothetical protein ACI4RI_01980 [Ruminococcus sp.]